MEPINSESTQAEASRQNGQLGGVKTAEGKAVTRYNTLTHEVLKQMPSDYEKPLYGQLLEKLKTNISQSGLWKTCW